MTMYSFRQLRNALLGVKGRPRGFPYGEGLTAERLSRLRAAPHLASYLAEMRAASQHAQSTPPPDLPFSLFQLFETTGARKEFERPYFDRRGRLLALTLNLLIDGNQAARQPLENLIWSICNEYSWALPAHQPVGVEAARSFRLPPEQIVDLFAAETGHALAETLAMVGEQLNPWMAYRVRTEVERRIFRPLFHDPVHFHWESVPMNWASVCAGAAGMAALLLVDDRERLAGMLDRVLRAMECFLEGYGDDGGCPEGIGYWTYGFGYYTYFAEMLYDYTGGQIDLLQGEKIRRIASFPNAISLSDGNFVNYSDGAARVNLHTGLVSRLVARSGAEVPALAGVPSFHGDHCYRWPHITRNLLWTDPALIGRHVEPGSVYLNDLAWVVERHAVGNTLVSFSAKGGHNAEPHNQNDLGNFIVHIGGESLLADLGAGLYTRAYFGPQRYEHIHNSSEGHSVPIVDGQPQQPGPEHAARVLRYERTNGETLFRLDLTRAYDLEHLNALTRTFIWRPGTRGATLELSDSFRFGRRPGALEEVFISLHQPALEAGAVTWRGERGYVRMTFDSARFAVAIETIDSQDHQAQPITVYRTRLRAQSPGVEEDVRMAFTCEGTP